MYSQFGHREWLVAWQSRCLPDAVVAAKVSGFSIEPASHAGIRTTASDDGKCQADKLEFLAFQVCVPPRKYQTTAEGFLRRLK